MIHTKIMATLGPVSGGEAVLCRLIESGADVFRLNFSHGSLQEHEVLVRTVRRVAEAMGIHVALVGDLCGPKIRLGEVANEFDGGMVLAAGDRLVIQRNETPGVAGRVSTNYPPLIDEIQIGHRLLIDDGNVRFIVIGKSTDHVVCHCTAGGVIRTRKGVNLPDTPVSVDSLTAEDLVCADWAVEQQLDYLALSFVRSADALHALRERLAGAGADIHLIAKIEKPEALRQIDPIIAASDAIMIARGDLGVEMDVARVPIIQKDLIRRCQAAGLPVIVATQMLQSMVHSPAPTRAEVSDVANAIFDGADAVMLSGETAVGAFPVMAVNTMNRVAQETEDYLFSLPHGQRDIVVASMGEAEDAALAHGANRIARTLDVRLIVVWSQTGMTARSISKLRPHVPVIALSSNTAALQRMALYFGVLPMRMEVPGTLEELAPMVDLLLLERGLAEPDQRILILGGTTLGMPGRSNTIMIHRVGRR